MDDVELAQAFPAIPWGEPVRITVAGVATGYACRACIAHFGFDAAVDAARLEPYPDVERHVAAEHPELVGYRPSP